ncbi:catalase [Corynebacterium maris DSM 45190]|uniref:Catalase n=1 Tax=Corynebacterium maris DSM 45190 TaxID=1224163 RepID=S5TGE6_9CORY|nr:catalase [Corynebacterium maris]AGS33748.1 catalase [Corynebacterium maris DSM 45190]
MTASDDKKQQDDAHVVPGAPNSITPQVEEPTTPTEPAPPKPDQKGPTPHTPAGKKLPVESEDLAQQGEYLTTAQGARLSNTDHSLRAGERGPVLLQDHHLREKIMHFDHERIPERVVHARGAAAHGVFVANGAAESVSKAGVFKKGKETEVFTRFSTVLGNRGSMDTARDTRGFATKFYTDEGVWDLVGNNIPVFFIQDAIKFPDVIHAAKPHPDREIPQAQSAHDTFWDFISLHTEAVHHMLWNMSDRGIPRSYRMMEGFGVNTFRMINDAGETSLVKFHWKPKLGVHSQVWEEAQITGGADPDFHRRDLADAIESGAYPEWDLGLQVFPDSEDAMFDGIDLLDDTKIIPEEIAPVQIVGTMTLNRNPSNYFAETEQVAFHPGHLVPGIDVSEDPMLQGRLFSYLDTQLTRLGGPNFSQIPINRPHTDVNDMFRDGFHQTAVHKGVAPYQPNSLDGGCPFMAGNEDAALIDIPAEIKEGQITRKKPESFDDHFSQPRMFYLSLSDVEKRHLKDAISFELGKCYEQAVKERMVDVLTNVDQGLAEGVAADLGLPAPAPVEVADVTTSPALSQLGKTWPIDGRQIGILTTEDSPVDEVEKLVSTIFDEGMIPLVIAPTGGKLAGSDVDVSRTYLTARSVEFDALIVADAPAVPAARVLLDEAFRHNKAIALRKDARADVEAAGVDLTADGVVTGKKLPDLLGDVKELLAAHRVWTRPVPAQQ